MANHLKVLKVALMYAITKPSRYFNIGSLPHEKTNLRCSRLISFN